MLMTAPRDFKSLQSVFSKETLSVNARLSFGYFFRDIFLYVFLFVLIWSTDRIYFLIPLWILLGMVSLGLYQIGHDTAHGSLFPGKRMSWWIGQIAFLPSLHPYGPWVYGHNEIHHSFTVRLKGDLAWHPRSPARYAGMTAFERIMHRIYWSFAGGGIYYLIKMWLQGLILFTPPRKNAKRDTVIVISFALIAMSFLLYFGGRVYYGYSLAKGSWFVVKLYLIPFIIINYFIGITVYIQHINPEIPWLREEQWTPYHGQLKGTTNYKLPGFVNFFIHNIFIHAPHHIQPAIPFYNLPEALDELRKEYGEDLYENRSFLKDLIRSFSACKLYDADRKKWVGYADVQDNSSGRTPSSL